MATRQKRDYENKSRGKTTGTWMNSVHSCSCFVAQAFEHIQRTNPIQDNETETHCDNDTYENLIKGNETGTQSWSLFRTFAIYLLEYKWFFKVVLDLQNWRGKAFPKGGCSWFMLQLKAVSWEIDALIDRWDVLIHHESNISMNHSNYCITGSATLHIIRNRYFSKIDTLVISQCHTSCTIPSDIKYFDFAGWVVASSFNQ